eukprot:CAMPEP_0167750996 /NCGR_PEP_ID=MMETSP0110_2-20121227/6311_1 /TAXON_ID=629695 /ORGANISM="Gymnochlora sp., Strain CCMP2014" /LENGTH=273 /DNA_ID=CAMNT_0007636399 /DNA_START=72 /DNA_END=893 /DNA_ORIENTATION=-
MTAETWDVYHAHTTIVDRWEISVYDNSKGKYGGDRKIQETKMMTNYFGIGLDGIIATKFHKLREGNPFYFGSRLINKIWYGHLGTQAYLIPPTDPLAGIEISVDNCLMDLKGLQGVVILNIPSYGGGSDLWGVESGGTPHGLDGRKNTEFKKPTHYDGLVEVVGVRDSLHMAQCQVGIASCVRLGQGRRVTIKASDRIGFVCQVDGEPWAVGKKTVVEVSLKKKAVMLSRSQTKEDNVVDKIEKVLMDAEIAGMISTTQHKYLVRKMVEDIVR